MWDWYFLFLDDIMKYTSHVILSCPLSCPTFWEVSGLVLSPITGFFSGLPTWAGINITFSRRFFKYHANMSLFICRSRGKHLVISSSYHTCISSIFNPLPYNTMYPSCLATSYGCPFVIVLVWSCHWRFKYPFALVPLRGWTYMSQPHFGQVWGWSPTLGKVGDLESSGTPECSELDSKGQNTSHWGVFSVIGKGLET
jgi:hypothetical protein